MKIEETDRGFHKVDFLDLYGKSCSLQESSLATEEAIWLGCDEGTHHKGYCLARMHLNREKVRELLPLLHRFVETGGLKPTSKFDECPYRYTDFCLAKCDDECPYWMSLQERKRSDG